MRITSALLVSLLAGCPDRQIAAVVTTQAKVESKDVDAVPNRDVDILFVIDNSGSMAEEQSSLRANFSKFMDVLATIQGGLPNVHIGVATSSLGQSAADGVGGASFGAGCAGVGDDGALRMTSTVTGRFIIDEEAPGGTPGQRNVNYSGTLGDAFSALADVGTQGCGIEQHLGAATRALSNPLNVGFLRDSAKLAVIIIGDEDDCSLAHKALFDGTADGTVVNFRCTSDGIACDVGNPDLSVAGLRDDCHPNDDAQYVSDVDGYAELIKDLKPGRPDDVIVAGIVGNPTPVEITTDETQHSVLAPSCEYAGQHAYPAVRTAAFLDQFRHQIREPICNADLSTALTKIGAELKSILDEPCFQSQLADADPAKDGLQPDCSVVDVQRLRDGTDLELGIVPACETVSEGTVPCWRIVVDDEHCFYTPTHLALAIDRGGEIPPSDVHTKASCVTTSATP